MHKLLRVPELLFATFGYADQLTRVACAATCKLWFDVAVALLWSSCSTPHLTALLDILGPRETVAQDGMVGGLYFKYVGSSIYRAHQCFITQPTQDRWDRFYKYSSAVTSLDASWSDDLSLSAASLLAGITHPTQGTYFPKLKQLYLSSRREHDLISSTIFLQVSLTSLCLSTHNYGSPNPPSIIKFASVVADRCPCLKSLEIDLFDLPTFHTPLPAILSRMSCLKTLFLCDGLLVHNGMLTAISRLKNLRSWEVLNDPPIAWPEGDFENDAFSRLDTLKGATVSMGLLDFLARPTFPVDNLRRISVYIWDPTQILPFVTIMQNSRLEDLDLTVQVKVVITDLLPISTLAHLQHLKISSGSMTITDQQLILLLSGCKKLRRISLSNSGEAPLTLRSVRFLVENFAAIEVIDIHIDAREIPEEDILRADLRGFVGDHAPAMKLCIPAREWGIGDAEKMEAWLFSLCKRCNKVVEFCSVEQIARSVQPS